MLRNLKLVLRQIEYAVKKRRLVKSNLENGKNAPCAGTGKSVFYRIMRKIKNMRLGQV